MPAAKKAAQLYKFKPNVKKEQRIAAFLSSIQALSTPKVA